MSIVAALVVSIPVVALVAVVLLVVRAVGADGYGHRTPPAPRSFEAGGLPSRPYRDR